MTADTPTIVFVHGAWADATGFGGSIRALRDRGFAAIGFANPLRHLTGDAAYLAALLGTISGPIVLVGHSYGGAVMSNAATGNEQVQALVFVNGWMPDEGESIQQLLESEAFADSLVPAALRPVPFTNPDGSEGVDLYLDRELFPEAFAADVDPETAAVMAATQRPWSGAAAATPLGPARRGGPFRRGTCSAQRTGRSRLQRSDSWPSARTRGSRRWRHRMRRWCRSLRHVKHG